MNILNSGRFGVGAGAGGGLRKLIGIKNREEKAFTLHITSLMPSVYFRHCIIKISRPEQPLLWLKIGTWVQISGHELQHLYCMPHDSMPNGDCHLCTHDHIYIIYKVLTQANKRLLIF